MHTTTALKIVSVLNGIFCFFCVAASVCFAVGYYFDLRDFFGIGVVLSYGWMINPIGIISFIFSLSVFLLERRSPEAKQIIGKKWIWIFVWPVITTVLWLISAVLMVLFTGGV